MQKFWAQRLTILSAMHESCRRTRRRPARGGMGNDHDSR
jgi:hypothetical protein